MAKGSSAILAVKIIGDAKGAKGAFTEAETGAGKLQSAFKKAGPMIGAAVAAGVAVATKELWDIGTTWEEVQNNLRVGTGAVGEDFEHLFGSVKSVASQVPNELVDVGNVVGDVNTRLNLTGKTLETVSRQYLDAGRILGETVDIEKTSAALNLFGIEGENVEGALDDLFRVSQGTGISMNDMASIMTKAGPALTNLGFSFGESAALAGVLDKAGIDASGTMNQMNRALVNLAKSGEEPQEAFQRVVSEIQGYVDTGNTAAAMDLAGTVFGTRGAGQFVTALQTGVVNLDDLMGAAGVTGDTILGLGQETLTTGEKFEILKNKAMVALEPLASSIVEGAGAAMDWFMNLVENVDWTPFQEGAAAVMSALEGLWPVFETLGELFMTLFPVVKTVFESILGVIKPAIATVKAVIDTVMAALRGDWKGVWDGIKSILSNVWETIKAIVRGAINNVKSIVQALNLRDIFRRILDGARTAVNNGIQKIVDWFRGLPNKIKNAIPNPLQMLAGAGRAIIDGFLGGLRKAWDAGKRFISGIGDWIKRNKGPISKDKVLLRPAGQAIMDGLVGSLQGQMPTLQRWVNEATDTIAGLATSPTIDLDARMPTSTSRHSTPAGSGAPIHITVQGALDPTAVARQIRDILNRDARVRGSVDLAGVVIG